MIRLASPTPLGLQISAGLFSSLLELDQFRRPRVQPKSKRPLLTLVRQVRGSQYTDLRDKLYCMVGFSADVTEPDLEYKIDYSRDVRAVYVDFAIWTMREYKSLDIFSDCDGLVSPGVSFSCWTPNWTRPWS